MKKRMIAATIFMALCTVLWGGDLEEKLIAAAKKGDVAEVQRFLEQGGMIDFQRYGMTALMVASKNGHFPVVKLLVSSGANINLFNMGRDTAGILAGDEDHKEIGQFLYNKAKENLLETIGELDISDDFPIGCGSFYIKEKTFYNHDFREDRTIWIDTGDEYEEEVGRWRWTPGELKLSVTLYAGDNHPRKEYEFILLSRGPYEFIYFMAIFDEAGFVEHSIFENDCCCPYVFVFNGNSWTQDVEIIQNIVGTEAEENQIVTLQKPVVINNQLRIKIAELKEETSYLNTVTIIVAGKEIAPLNCPKELTQDDNLYLKLEKGEELELIFPVENSSEKEIFINAKGYYIRN